MDTPSHRFKIIHQQIKQILETESIDLENLQKKVAKYISVMIEDDQEEQQKMFDFFCEFNGSALLAKLISVDSLMAIKSYSLLFINLKNEMWISFILCQPFLMQAINIQNDSADEQWTQYYVSFLKSLSIRINDSQITLFYNKKNNNFPLVFQAMKYFNHPDFMVRTSVMNIILELMKIKQQKAIQYFSRFPFTSYIITFSCEVHQLIQKYRGRLSQQCLNTSAKHLKNYGVDLSDYLYYFNDLITFGTEKSIQIIENSIINYLVIPTFNWLLSQNKKIVLHSILIIHQLIRIIKNQNIICAISHLLFNLKISGKFIQKIRQFESVYLPRVFKQEFNPHQFYWSQYKNEITGHCLKIFKGIDQFDIQYEESNHQSKPEFEEQVSRMSSFVQYQLLKDQRIGQKYPQKLLHDGQLIDNPFKQLFLSIFEAEENTVGILITSILIKIMDHPFLSQQTKITIQLQSNTLQPQISTQINQYNQPHLLSVIKQSLLKKLTNINWTQTTVINIQNILLILQKVITEPESIQFQQELLRNYRDISFKLLQFIVPENMTFVVDKFYNYYQIITKEMGKSQMEGQIPYSTLFLQQSKWDQPHLAYSLPNNTNSQIQHFIQHFFTFRSYIVRYFTKFYEAEYTNFGKEYELTFEKIKNKYKKGQNYHIQRPCIICQQQIKQQKKKRKVMIIEDRTNFILAEIDQLEFNGCKILANQSWKNVSFEICRDEGTAIEVIYGEKNHTQKYRLKFQDQIRSKSTQVKMSDVKWQSYQYQLSFLYKFVKKATEQ